MTEVTKEMIDSFFAGSDPMERIIKIECGYDDEKVSVIYKDEKGKKFIRKEDFYPFCWCKESACLNLYEGDRSVIRNRLLKYGIGVKALRTNHTDGTVPERMEHGFKYMFYARKAMSFAKFQQFFKNGERPLYSNSNEDRDEYIVVSPVEQYMIYTGKRQFKGYNEYDDLTRFLWDLETEGLDPHIDMISQIGIRTNKGYEKIITVHGKGEEKFKNELNAIIEFLEIIQELKADIMAGHNTENFDWYFIDVRLKIHGFDLLELSKQYLPQGVYKKDKQTVLKLGGEMEYYKPTCMWGTHICDSLFAVRRAMALDSNMKKADLKYATKYSKLEKPNRVYVPGKIINSTWEDMTPSYALNDDNGHWFNFNEMYSSKRIVENGETRERYVEFTDENGKRRLKDMSNGEVFEFVTGRYIVERYLLDDLYETDRVEHKFNNTNFFVSKMLPVSYEKACTMGTAAVWKYIMLAWSYEYNLAIPSIIQTHKFCGGLSRLLNVGFVDSVVKLDYNSLYPSIILSYGIKSDIDIMGVMSALLEYILTNREYYKELKKDYGKKAGNAKNELKNEGLDESERKRIENDLIEFSKLKSLYDSMQSAIKVIGNGFFGSYGSGRPFPWSDLNCAEETTCTGRQCLRLMIKVFTDIGYKPIVGDSVTEDTPLFVKNKTTGFILIKSIGSLFSSENKEIDELGREYDYSYKNYQVLARSGWCDIEYIYRHKTDKDIYTVTDGETSVDVTEDHSLFDHRQNEIKPSEITEDTKLEYYVGKVERKYKKGLNAIQYNNLYWANEVASGKCDEIPAYVFNYGLWNMADFYEKFMKACDVNARYSKCVIAGLQYIKRTLENPEYGKKTDIR